MAGARRCVALVLLACLAFASAQPFTVGIEVADTFSTGQPVAVSVSVFPAPPGDRFITVADDTGVNCLVETLVDLGDGVVGGDCTLVSLPPGIRTVSAVLSPSNGDSIPASSIVDVSPLLIDIAVDSTPSPSDLERITVSFTLTSSIPSLIPTGSVTVFNGFVEKCTSALVLGVGSCELDLSSTPPTSFNFDVVYEPNDLLFPATHVTYQHNVEVTVQADATFGRILAVLTPELDMSFTLSSPDSGFVPRGVVDIFYDSQLLCTLQTFDGTGECNAQLTTFQPHVNFVVLSYGGEDGIHPATDFELNFVWFPAIVPLDLLGPYVDTFEDSEVFWFPEPGGRSNWELGVPDPDVLGGAASGTVAWATDLDGFYENDIDSILLSPIFDLSFVSGQVTVGMKLNYDIEAAVDALTLEMKLGSRAWLRVGSSGDPIDWYNDPRNAWSDTSDGFVQVFHDISEAAGERSVQFRLRLVTDSSEREAGALFDDFSLSTRAETKVSLDKRASTQNTIGVRVETVRSQDPQGSVIIADPSAGSCTATLSRGTGQCSLSVLTPGVKNLLLTYNPSDVNVQSTSSVQFGRLSAVTLLDRQTVTDEFDNSVFSLPLLWYVESGIWERGTPEGGVIFGASSRQNAWVTNLNGPYPLRGERHVLTSGLIDATSTNGEIYFSADIWYDLTFTDRVRLEVSKNGGNSFAVQHLFGGGRTTGWERFTFNVDNADGSLLQFRLVLDPLVASGADPDGFGIDNIQISAESRPVALEHNLPSALLQRIDQVLTVTLTSPHQPFPLVDDTPAGTITLFSNGMQTTCNSVPLVDGSASCSFEFNSGGSKEVEIRYSDSSNVHVSTTFYHVIEVLDRSIEFEKVYTDDFEDDVNPAKNWSPAGLPVWELSSPGLNGILAWTTDRDGLHDDSLEVSVVSPVFDFRALEDDSPVILNFLVEYDLASGDHVFFEATTFEENEDPARWFIVTAAPGAMGWYSGSNGFSGSASATTIINSIVLGGRYAQFRFRLSADAERKGTGFTFDDFSITTGQVEIATEFGTEQPGSRESVPVTFTVSSTLADVTGGEALPAGIITVSQNGVDLCVTDAIDAEFQASCDVAAFLLDGPVTATFTPSDDFHGPLTVEIAYPFVEQHVPALPFLDTFERQGLIPAWRSTGVWEFGVLDAEVLAGANSGLNTWATNLDGDHPSGIDATLYSPVFDFRAVSASQPLYFGADIAYFLETCCDVVVLEVDVGLTGTFEAVGDVGPVNWYNGEAFFNGWSGRTFGFIQAYHEMNVQGEYAQFRFVLSADEIVHFEGFAFDDVEFTTRDPTTTTAVAAPETTELGEEVVITATQVSLTGNINAGWVTFRSNIDGVLCDAVVIDESTGTAVCSVVVDSAGFHTVQLEYIPNPPLLDQVVAVDGEVTFSVNAIVPVASLSSLPYFDDFEDAEKAPWTQGGTDDAWQLGVPQGDVITETFSGNNAWTTALEGGHDSFVTAFLQSPVFDLTAIDEATRIFASARIWFSSEEGFDGTILQMSLDDGPFETVGAAGDEINWYSGFGFWTGQSAGYVLAQHELPAAAGKRVQLRFAFFSDAFFVNDGFAFDDFSLFTEQPALITATLVPEAQSGSIERLIADVTLPFGAETAEGTIRATTPSGSCEDVLVDGHGECLLDLIDLLNELVLVEVEYIPAEGSSSAAASIIIKIVVHVTVRIDQDDFPYLDSFDGEEVLWVSDDPSVWEIGSALNLGTASGENAWATNLEGDYANARDGTVTSPVFDLTGIEPEVPIFFAANINYNSELGFDGAHLEMSLDNGPYSVVGVAGDIINWYNTAGNFWSGESGGFVRAVHLLPDAAGRFLQLRMRFISDSNIRDFPGFAFDDVIISNGLSVDIDVEYTTPDPAVVGTPVELGFQVIANNLIDSVVEFSGVVTVVVDTSEQCVSSFSSVDGRGACTIVFDSPGENEVQFILNGPTFFERFVITRTIDVVRASSQVKILTVNNDNGPSIQGLPTLVTFEVTSERDPTPFGRVTIGDESGATCVGVLDADGLGSCEITFPEPAASHELIASYTGDFLHAPSVEVSAVTISERITLTQLPLVDDFETDVTYYRDVRGEETALWELGTPVGDVIQGAASGANAWATSLGFFHREEELDYVYSPAYSTVGVPVGADLIWCADVWYSMSFREHDGAFLEVSYDRGAWTKVGKAGEVRWYTDPVTDVWNRESGGYVRLCHPLSESIVSQTVQTRVAFSVQNEEVHSGDGFAFDNAGVQITAPTHLSEVRSDEIPIRFGDVRTLEVTVLSVSPDVPEGRGVLTLGNGQKCNETVDGAGQWKCAFIFNDPTTRHADAVFAEKEGGIDEGSSRSFVLPIEYQLSTTFALNSAGGAFRDDFEATASTADWWTRHPNVWEQGPSPILGASSGTSAWVTYRRGVYENSLDSSVNSPRFDPSRTNTEVPLYVSANVRYNLADGDTVVFEYRDGALPWTPLVSSGVNFPVGGWTGVNDRFQPAHNTLPLGSSLSTDLQFRFRLQTNADGVGLGFAFDDFELSAAPPVSLAIDVPGQVHLDQEFTVGVTVESPFIDDALLKGSVIVWNAGEIFCTADVDGAEPFATSCAGTIESNTTAIVNLVAEFVDNANPLLGQTVHQSNVPWRADVFAAALTVTITPEDDIYTDSFESGLNWNGEALWSRGAPAGRVINEPFDGLLVWGTDLRFPHDPSLRSLLFSPIVDATALTETVYLSAWIWYDMAADSGRVFVEQSLDGEAWTVVGAVGDTVNWYTGDDPDGWSGKSNDWVFVQHELPGAVGRTVQVRFVTVGSGTEFFDGFAVDLISIGDLPLPTVLHINDDEPSVTALRDEVTIYFDVQNLFDANAPPEGIVTIWSSLDEDPVCSGTSNIFSGFGTCSTNDLVHSGVHVLSATFVPEDGEDAFGTSSTTSDAQFLERGINVHHLVAADTPVVQFLEVNPNPSAAGRVVKVVVFVSVPVDGTNPAGSVVVSDSLSEASCSAVLSFGSGTCYMVFSNGGERVLTATFTADDEEIVSSSATIAHTVLATTTTVDFVFPSPSFPGTPVLVRSLVESFDDIAVSGGVVVFDNVEFASCVSGLFDGSSECTLTMNTPGEHLITVSYVNVGFDSPSSSTTFVHVVDNTRTTYTSITFDPPEVVVASGPIATAHVFANDLTEPAGTVTFTVDGVIACADVAVTQGEFFATATCELAAVFEIGERVAEAQYSSTNGLPGSSASLAFSVVDAFTSITAASSPNPSRFPGQTVVSGVVVRNTEWPFTASVSVTDTVGDAACVAAVDDDTGVFSCTLTLLNSGFRNLTVVYPGDEVNPAASTKVLHFANATVAPQPPGQTPVPTATPVPDPNNGPTLSAALAFFGTQRVRITGATVNAGDSVIVANNKMRELIRDVLGLLSTQRVGIDNALTDPFEIALIPDQGRLGLQLGLELKVLVDVRADSVRLTALDGAEIELIAIIIPDDSAVSVPFVPLSPTLSSSREAQSPPAPSVVFIANGAGMLSASMVAVTAMLLLSMFL